MVMIMPNLAPFNVNNGTVDVSYRPDSVTGTNVLFYEDDETKQLAELGKVNYDRPAKGDTLRRTCRINVPHKINEGTSEEQTIWLTGRIEYVIDKRATKAMRDDLIARVTSLSSASATVATISTPEWFW